MHVFDRLLKLVCAAVLAVSLLPLGARLWWVLDLTTHFRVQYVVLCGVLLVALAARGHTRWSAALALAAVLNAVPVLPYVPLPAAPAAHAAGEPLKALSVNVSYGEFSAKRLLEIERSAAPDLMLVVEFTRHAERLLADSLDAEYPYKLKLPARRRDGIALWSKYPLASAERMELGTTVAIEAQVEGPTGPFKVLGVHLSAPTSPWRAADRNVELELLAQKLASVEGPVLVMGDFNVTPYSPYFADWLKTTGVTDTRRGRTLSASWPAVLPMFGIPIDHCVVSQEFDVIAHHRLPDFGSDHYAIMAEVTWPRLHRAP